MNIHIPPQNLERQRVYCMMDKCPVTRIVVENVEDEVSTKVVKPLVIQTPSPRPTSRARSRRTNVQWMLEPPPTIDDSSASADPSSVSAGASADPSSASVAACASTSQDDTEDSPPPTSRSFAKLVRTVQFIKKWSKRAEKGPDTDKEEFLDRFKMNDIGADSAFNQSTSEEELISEDGSRRDCGYLWRVIKRRRHLPFIWNPSGHWLYR